MSTTDALKHGPLSMGSQRVIGIPTIDKGKFTPDIIYISNFQQQSPNVYYLQHISLTPKGWSTGCQTREYCVRELNTGRWRQRRVCYHDMCRDVALSEHELHSAPNNNCQYAMNFYNNICIYNDLLYVHVGTSTKKGQLVPTVREENWLSRLRMYGQQDTMHFTLRYTITM